MKLSDPVLGGATTEEGQRREAQRAAVNRLLSRLDHLVGLCAATVVLDEIGRWETWLQGVAGRVEKLKLKGFSRAQGLLTSAKPVYRAALECREKLDTSTLGQLAEQVRKYYEELNNLQDEHLPNRDVVEAEAERLAAVLRDLETTIQGVLTECRTPLLGIKGKIDSVEEVLADLEGAYGALESSTFKLQEGEILVGSVSGELIMNGPARPGLLFVSGTRLVFELIERSWIDTIMNFFSPRPPRRELLWEQPVKQIRELAPRRDDGLVSRLAIPLENATYRGSPENAKKLVRLLQVLKPALKSGAPATIPGGSPKKPGTPDPSAS